MTSTEMLEWLKAVGALACSWPALVLLALFVFRKPLVDLIKQLTGPGLQRAKLGPLEIELRELAKEGKHVIDNMSQLHQETGREMGELAEKGTQAVEGIKRLHTETEQEMSKLAEKGKQAIERINGIDASITRQMEEFQRRNEQKIDSLIRRMSEWAAGSSPIGKDATAPAFVHIATHANTHENYTTIDHPLTNNKPEAILIVTQNWSPPTGKGGVYNPQPIGVWYTPDNKWSIFNQDQRVAMPIGAAFNVQVLNP